MAVYIDADVMISNIRINDYLEVKVDGKTLKKWIKAQPTADVVPVIHAHWIEEEDCSIITEIPWSMCSACGEYSLKLPYCAFCGAKMDEVSNEY